jgi:hypothetical protein
MALPFIMAGASILARALAKKYIKKQIKKRLAKRKTKTAKPESKMRTEVTGKFTKEVLEKRKRAGRRGSEEEHIIRTFKDEKARKAMDKRALSPLNTGRKQMEFSVKAIRSNNKVARRIRDPKERKILAENTKMHKENIAKFKKPRREARDDIKKNRSN